MGYKIVRFFIHAFLRLIAHIEVFGFENLPTSGSYIAAGNHLGRLDIPLVYYLIDRPDVILLVAEKYKESAFFRWFFNQLNGIWLDRFNADWAALRLTLQRLKKGEVLVLAPEGTRSPTEALILARPGVSYLAAKSGVPLVPAALIGTEDRRVKEKLRHFRRVHIKVWIGKPFTLPPIQGHDREAVLASYTDEIMCQIAALLPASYRGVYADHPRLKELLA